MWPFAKPRPVPTKAERIARAKREAEYVAVSGAVALANNTQTSAEVDYLQAVRIIAMIDALADYRTEIEPRWWLG